VEGVSRFLNRVWRLFIDEDGKLNSSIKSVPPGENYERLYHQTVRKVGEDIENLRFNTAISQMMIFLNETMKLEVKPKKHLEGFILLLSPFAPHLCEELWKLCDHNTSLAYEDWPEYDVKKCIEANVEIVFQVNGKIRSKAAVTAGMQRSDVEKIALEDANVKKYLDGTKIVRIVFVPDKLVNIVIT
jgi:leucyl-tRNA synthetase